MGEIPAAEQRTAPALDATDSPARHCPNCGTPVADRFCPHCGQRYQTRLVSLRRMAAEFVDDQLALNGTLPRTLGALLFRPGFLTREYREGRIVRYLPPLRLFLVSTLAFFVAVSCVADPDALWRDVEGRIDDPSELRRTDAQGRDRWDNVNFQIDSTRVPGWLMPAVERLQIQQDRLNSVPPREMIRSQVEGLIEAAARIAFLLVPLFAALLMLLHPRQRRLYAEHFVFALHFHAAAFLMLSVAIAFQSRTIGALAFAWHAVYLLVALRRSYEQPWWLAAAKLLVVLVVYPVILGVGATAATLMAIALA